jgi:nucleoid DNA-binding protein/DNA-directed RNA polymerase subunit RPC12/RpoP
METKSYTKQDLVREIAFTVGITQKKARFVLDALQFIAYREAGEGGFTIPGICKLDVIRRKERQMRNPQTGEKILMAEHNALRARILKKAKDTVTPTPEGLITYIKDEAKGPQIYDDFSQAVSFRCKKCGQEIEAPKAAVGIESECPVCNTAIVIPDKSEPGTMHGDPLPAPAPEESVQPVVSTQAASFAGATTAPGAAPSEQSTAPTFQSFKPATHDPSKHQTIRIDLAALGIEEQKAAEPKRMISFFCKNCRQEIEAPTDMAGSSSECPACGVTFEVPFFSDQGTLHGSDLERTEAELKSIKGRTIRIEVPDDI